jgi:hypothetical protein
MVTRSHRFPARCNDGRHCPYSYDTSWRPQSSAAAATRSIEARKTASYVYGQIGQLCLFYRLPLPSDIDSRRRRRRNYWRDDCWTARGTN